MVNGIVPVKSSHDANPIVANVENIKKADEPAMDLSLLKNHLFDDPSLRPTRSAVCRMKEL